MGYYVPMDFTYIDNLNGAYVESRILHTGVELNIFNTIGYERLTAREIAERIKANPRSTELFLNALVALNLLYKEGKLFSLTPVAKKYLLSDSSTCYEGLVRLDSRMWSFWKDLPEAVRTGKPVKKPDMYQSTKEETECFIMAMHHLVKARGDAEYLARKIKVMKEIKRILDVGSGPGTYPIAFTGERPDLEITIFDLPGTIEVTEKILDQEGLKDKIGLVRGDYNKDPLPKGFDLIFLSNIIHSEDEETNKKLMKKIYKSLNPGGFILIKDHIMDETLTKPACGAIFTMYMLLTTNGRDYAYREIKDWLVMAGFKDIKCEKLPSPFTSSLVWGRKE